MTGARVCNSCASRLDDVLHRMRTRRGVSAAQWLWAPASGESGHVLVGGGTVVVHPDIGGPAVEVRVTPGALPLASRSVPALVVLPVLPAFADLDGLFAELRRVLRPHGLLTMAVPDGPALGPRGRRLRARVRSAWRHRSSVDHPDWLLTAADFAVLGDDRLTFRVPAPIEDAATHVDALCAAGLVPSALPPELRQALVDHPALLRGQVPLRRLVARR